MEPHQKNSPANGVEWLTPPGIIAALGEFDLDPCTPEVMPWPTARRRFTRREDGLSRPWIGRIWLNPPFGREAAKWLARMREHGDGVALVPARTDTRMFFNSVWGHAAGICFIRGRPHFHYPDGARSATGINAPVCLIAYGENNLAVIRRCGFGAIVTIRRGGKRRA